MTKSSPGRKSRKAARKSALSDKSEGAAWRFVGTSQEPRIEIPIEKLGHPGSLSELHVVAQFPNDIPSEHSRRTDRIERTFETSALLSTTQNPKRDLNFQTNEEDGSSYFLFEPPALRVDTPWGPVTVRKNRKGESALVKMTCEARSSTEALERLQRATATFLDHWAYEAVAPVYLTMLRARDVKNHIETLQFVSPFRSSTISPSTTEIPTPLRPMFALYRESLCSASPLYKFLCLYKILEGYFGRLKPTLSKIFRDAGLQYPLPRDLVPDHPDLETDMRAYVGQSISKFRDELLTTNFRVAVAHFEKEGESPLIASDPGQINRFSQIGLAVELCARVVIESYQKAFKEAIVSGLDVSSLSEISN